MIYKIRQTSRLEEIESQYKWYFPDTRFDPNDTYWEARKGGTLVGFCSVKPLEREPGVVFFSSAVVLKVARGKGLHKRFIRVRKAWCRREGFSRIITYCHRDNIASATNLLYEGFKLYQPEYKWVGVKFMYFIFEL